MSKFLYDFVIAFLLSSCQIIENLTINEKGSGSIEITDIRQESSSMQVVGEQYGKEDFYKDKTYVFKECIEKYNSYFIKYTPAEQVFFSMFKEVRVHINKSSFDKKHKTICTTSFEKAANIPMYIKRKITQMILKIIMHSLQRNIIIKFAMLMIILNLTE